MSRTSQILGWPVRNGGLVRLLKGQTERRLTALAVAAALDLGVEPASSLAARFVAGGAGRFELLVELHAARVGRLAQRLLGWRDDGVVSVEDVVQDVFVAA